LIATRIESRRGATRYKVMLVRWVFDGTEGSRRQDAPLGRIEIEGIPVRDNRCSLCGREVDEQIPLRPFMESGDLYTPIASIGSSGASVGNGTHIFPRRRGSIQAFIIDLRKDKTKSECSATQRNMP